MQHNLHAPSTPVPASTSPRGQTVRGPHRLLSGVLFQRFKSHLPRENEVERVRDVVLVEDGIFLAKCLFSCVVSYHLQRILINGTCHSRSNLLSFSVLFLLLQKQFPKDTH